MKSDHWFYGIFRDLPWLLFRLMGLPETHAAGYRFDAVELKAVSLRLDGIFCPGRPNEPYFFLEAQLYKDAEFYRKWLVKIVLYAHQYRIEEDWRGLVLFGNRGHEPNRFPVMEEWIASGRIRRVFLDELPDYPDVSLEVAVLKLAVTSRETLIEKARDLVTVAKAMESDLKGQKKLLGIIEAFLVSNFPRLSRAEIQAMLQLHDIRESTIFQEGVQEGRQEGRQEGKLEARVEMINRLHSLGLPCEKICEYSGLDEKVVRNILAANKS
jgi:predicted transposase/invertase (TIGR01784 family)